MLDSFVHPIKYQGVYPSSWAGFTFKERLNYGVWLSTPGYHLGVDYNHGTDDLGDPVYAVGNGIVKSSSQSSAYGYRITIEHTLSPALAKKLGTSKILTLYGHVRNSRVRAGQKVSKGQQIAEVGNAGTTFPHLHFEMYKPHNYSAVKSIRTSYPADNLSNLNSNYFDGYRVIQANLKTPTSQGDEMANEAQVKKIYQAVLHRAGDKNGIAHYTGKNANTIVESMYNSAEFKKHDNFVKTATAQIKKLNDAMSNLSSRPTKAELEEALVHAKIAQDKLQRAQEALKKEQAKAPEVIEKEIIKEVNPGWLEAVIGFIRKILRIEE